MNPGRWAGLALAALTLGGCAHYAPAPAHPGAFPAAFDARRLDEMPAGAHWTGADLLQAAVARNPQIAEARARYLTALAAARTAKLTPGLTLTLTAEYADEAPRWGYGGAAEVPLDFGARRGDRITSADLQALQAFYAYGEAVWSVRTALEKARIDLAAANAGIALADRAAQLRRDREARVERRVSAGQDARSLALTAQTERVAAERRAAEARGRREQALVDMATGLGVAPAAVRGLAIADPQPVPALDDLTAWRRDAALSRADVLKAVADYDLAESALRLEVARQYPEVRIGPGYTYDHGANKLPFNLTMAFPTYDLNRRAIAQAEAGRAAAGKALEAAQAQALGAVDTATVALATARADVDRNRDHDLPIARRTAASAARSVSAGETDRADDLAAQAAEVEAELALADAQHVADTAATDLEDALRHPFDPAETATLKAAMAAPAIRTTPSQAARDVR